ncbi:MAG: M15 family metallopeptidase [Clostridia bacterium]|nr:M15 family metallopeptidase [Clostridia bacterium]
MKKTSLKILSAIFAVVFAFGAFPAKLLPELTLSVSAAQEYSLRKVDGKWQYFASDSSVDTAYKGLAKNEYGWWYVKDGEIDFSYTGMAKNQYGWFYAKNGRLDTTYTGLADNDYGTWYLKNGKLDTTFTGMAKDSNGWHYVKNGKVNNTYTGMAKNPYGWWYFTNGKIDYSYKGLAKNDYGWWYIENGTINFKYNGNAKNAYGYWVVTNGKVNTSATWKYNYALPTPQVASTSGDWKLLLVNRDYSLPANYLDSVKLVYVCNSSERLDSRAAVYYEKMYKAAAAEGIYLTPCSGYRSYDLQKRNFENRINANISYGYSKINATLEASKVILPPGTSEHNAGLAMDIISVLDSFENSAQYRWLCAHAQDYGFILRYPKDKQNITKIVFEPWHWRYVGVEAAKAMKSSGKCLEEYLGKA